MNDQGVTSVQFLLGAVLGLVLFLALANLVVVQYGRGAVQSALDQGARAGTFTGSVSECEQRVDEVLGQLLGGTMGEGIVAVCEANGATVVARASAVFTSWTPLVPEFSFEMVALAMSETPP